MLTTPCKDMWPGIEVWGNSAEDQLIAHGGYKQGYLELKNGATVENAVCAVELSRPNYSGTSGGIVYADSAFFINNAMAVHAHNYIHYSQLNNEQPYYSQFRNCTFSIDNNYNGSNPFVQHVYLENINSLEFLGCNFSVNPNVTGVSSTNCAIKAHNAGFTATAYCSDPNHYPNPTPCSDEYLKRCSFTGFNDAVHSVQNGSSARTFTVSDAVFSQNNRGISNQNTNYATIIRNSFSVGLDNDCAFGIYADHVASFCIEENDFSPSSGFLGESYGIGLFTCQGANDIYRNFFDNLTCGNLAVGTNTVKANGSVGTVQGVTYSCNQNTGNVFDFCVLKDNGSGSILPQQGSSTLPAGNTFGASAYHFYNDGDDTVDYYYKSNATGQTPSNAKLYRVTRHSTTIPNSCPSHYGNGLVTMSQDELEGLESDYLAALEAYNRLKTIYENMQDEGDNPEDLNDIAALMAQYAHACSLAAGDIVRSILNDTVVDTGRLRNWLVNAGDIASHRMAIASLVQEDDFENALKMAESLPELYNLQNDELYDHANYLQLLHLYRALHDSGRTADQMTNEEIELVEGIAQNGSTVSGSMALAFLETAGLRNDPSFSCPELPETDSKGRCSSETEEHDASVFSVTVVPNPVSAQATVEYVLPEDTPKAILTVVNSHGENIATVNLDGYRGSHVLNLNGMPSGVYLVVITDGYGNTYSEKLVKQ